jgi:hypothetical protein
MDNTNIMELIDKNKYLIVNVGVRLTPVMIPVILGMEVFFEEEGVIAHITSGERTSQDQLDIIVKYAKRYDVDKEFPEILTCGIYDTIEINDNKRLFTWQRPWSRLLNKNVIINPPRPAICLFDYWRNGINKKGSLIGLSPHFYGMAYDIGGGTDHDITNELKCVKRAFESKTIPGFKGYLPERNNNCIHIDCK